MPIVPAFDWAEDETGLEIVVPLKGNKASAVDVFAASNFVKVSFAQYLLELNLTGLIDDTKVRAASKDGKLMLKLVKAQRGLWSELSIKGDKQMLRERRQRAVQERSEKETKLREQAKERRADVERTTLRAQMAMEQAEKQKIEDLKAEEKKRAEDEMYQTFSEMEAQRVAAAEAKVKPTQQELDGQQQQRLLQSEAPLAACEGMEETKQTPPPTLQQGMASQTPAEGLDGRRSAEIFEDGDLFDGEENMDDSSVPPLVEAGTSEESTPLNRGFEQEVVHADAGETETRYVPGPRVAGCADGRVKVSFTPRMFPTPMRESKREEEDNWIARNRPYLRKNKALASNLGDARDISEADPVWLKGKGDDFYRHGDIQAAVNAFSASLDLEPSQPKVLSNRATCYLRLGRAPECVKDCGRALELAVVPEDLKNDVHMQYGNKTLRLRLHVKRGTAYCQLGEYSKALEDYRAALYHAPDDASLAADLGRIDLLSKCQALKRRGDEALSSGDVQCAVERYTEALALEPSFVPCLSNRAAAYMAVGDLSGCVKDCDAAIVCLEAPVCEQDASGCDGLNGVPPPASEKRRQWVLRTIARRGAAKAAMDDLRGAQEDYRMALGLEPGDEGLRKDLERIEVRLGAPAALLSVAAE